MYRTVIAIFCLVVLEPQGYSVGKRFTVVFLWLRVVVHPIEDGAAYGLIGLARLAPILVVVTRMLERSGSQTCMVSLA